MADSALISVVKANDVTIVADKDHSDGAITAYIESQLPAMAKAGVRHLYLEHDAKEVTLAELVALQDAYGSMVRAAQQQGMQIHLYDDRTAERARDARFPEAAAFADKNDPYFLDPEALIAKAPNPAQMRDYIQVIRETQSNGEARNASIVTNLDQEMRRHPNEKAAVILGAWHTEFRNDVDEGLRAKGHQTSTIEVHSKNTLITSRGPDVPDFIANTETGQAITYKVNPADEHMRRIMEGVDLPWRSSEPVLDTRNSQSGQLAAPVVQNDKQPSTQVGAPGGL